MSTKDAKTKDAKSFTFDTVSNHPNFPSMEEEILKQWEKKDTFQESMRRSREAKLPEYMFYDGPPFATGLPHYGHILAGTIKDIVTRYAHQTGHHVERRFGWDCHGLPVEHAIDKKLGIKTKEDVLEMGVDRYNAECRSIVMRYSGAWREIITRCGRWIDFDNDYKTLDTSFMESVWWVFKQLHQKNLVYRGFKVMPYSTACTTPLSNFETAQNYKQVRDPSVIVNFPLLKDGNTCLLAWTTTPWTLPSNVALCVNLTFEYVKVKDHKTGKNYILAKSRLPFLYRGLGGGKKAPENGGGGAGKKKRKKNKKKKKKAKEEAKEESKKDTEPKTDNQEGKKKPEKKAPFDILEELKGADLVGLEYVPLFDFFKDQREKNGAFRVVSDEYVTDGSGVGIVHQAPAFGEDDYRVCLANGIIKRGDDLVCPVDDNGIFNKQVGENLAGKHVKGKGSDSADSTICRMLKADGRLVMKEEYDHEYPHCWRSDTPLIYRAVPSWFVNVPKIRDKIVENNKKTFWVPDAIKTKRFHNWLVDARDWAVSRNRYWGTPIPVWTSEDGKEIVVVGSIEELTELSGVQDIKDLHKDVVDKIAIPDPRGKGYPPMKRTPEVFDCWFESGSMPYGQLHYPFENKEAFEAKFPADFIAEGLDQTRGWFYTLMVISTALFDKPAFKNLIVNGLVLAKDGRKMSKRLKNYPDPKHILSEYGADALRLYLINSPVVRAQELAFKEMGVKGVVKDVILPWYHAMKFFIENARRYEDKTGKAFSYDVKAQVETKNKMDKWILLRLDSIIAFVRKEMKVYHLYTVIPELVKFIDHLTNTYVRFNRDRMKGIDGNMEEANYSLQTLYHVLLNLCRLMAPFTPFLVEFMYQNLKVGLTQESQEDSVHFLMIPETKEKIEGGDTADYAIEAMACVVDLGRSLRSDHCSVPLKTPIRRAMIVHRENKFVNAAVELEGYIKDQLNCKCLDSTTDLEKYANYEVSPNRKLLGVRLGRKQSAVSKALMALKMADILKFQKDGKITVEGEEVDLKEVDLDLKMNPDIVTKEFVGQSNGQVLVILDLKMDDELLTEGKAREVLQSIMNLRKTAKLNPEDYVDVYYTTVDAKEEKITFEKAISSNEDMFKAKLRTLPKKSSTMPKGVTVIAKAVSKIGEGTITTILVKPSAKEAPAKK
ncbi:hypothetical protein AAMO2058_000026800 [Amorphochlora amoebiformis]|uniref:isoleucine--tRNA ligase n=1 Tax=Amorphochlora amoebiformis TaxID=1561963 RepID=A0A7S0DPL1_9EUKA|mmetsp:Transcript_3708/g.5707  ORF Transcript_3708/g.5707 Transcript_3708/m.5707 type:complete len:1166 (+) Transcript_3708:170-3667(+)